MRKRNVGGNNENEKSDDSSAPIKSQVKHISPAEQAEKYVLSLAESTPKSVKPYILSAAPIVGLIVNLIANSIPYIEKLYVKYTEIMIALKPYRPELLTPTFFGLIMCFFGGSYLTLIAAVEVIFTLR